MKLWMCVFTVNILYQNVKSAFCLKLSNQIFCVLNLGRSVLLSFLTAKLKTCILQKSSLWSYFSLRLRSSNVLLPILLIIVKTDRYFWVLYLPSFWSKRTGSTPICVKSATNWSAVTNCHYWCNTFLAQSRYKIWIVINFELVLTIL